jgi:hypothetical protein
MTTAQKAPSLATSIATVIASEAKQSRATRANPIAPRRVRSPRRADAARIPPRLAQDRAAVEGEPTSEDFKFSQLHK